MWNYEGISFMVVVFGFTVGLIFLIYVLVSTGELVSWAWEKIRILRRRDGQDV